MQFGESRSESISERQEVRQQQKGADSAFDEEQSTECIAEKEKEGKGVAEWIQKEGGFPKCVQIEEQDPVEEQESRTSIGVGISRSKPIAQRQEEGSSKEGFVEEEGEQFSDQRRNTIVNAA